MQENTSYSHYLHEQTRELWCSRKSSNSADNLEQRTSCEHRTCLSIVLVTTLICTLHSFNHSCCLTLKVFLRRRSFRTTSAGGSSVQESCSDLLKSIRRSALRLELDFETFWLHFKGWVHCTSLPHVVSTEPVIRSPNMYMGPRAVFGTWLTRGDRGVEWFPRLFSQEWEQTKVGHRGRSGRVRSRV